MPFTIYDSGEKKKEKKGSTSVAPGVVKEECDLLMQGKMHVRIPSEGIDVWARVIGAGGGDDRGLMFFPQPGDEVLVAFNAQDPRDAFILGGLWSTKNSPPGSTPLDPLTKRKIKTGMGAGLSHEMEMDDATQKITIKASMGQTITMSATGIDIEADALTSISLETLEGSITITVGENSISLGLDGITITAMGQLNLNADAISINGDVVQVTGGTLMLNS